MSFVVVSLVAALLVGVLRSVMLFGVPLRRRSPQSPRPMPAARRRPARGRVAANEAA